jgi:porin
MPGRGRPITGAWAVLLLLCAATPAAAGEGAREPYAGDLLARPALTGDWGGGRIWLQNEGITLKPRVSLFYQGLTAGEGDHSFEFGGKADLELGADLTRLGAWKGLSLVIHAEYNFGHSVNGAGGTVMPINTALAFPGMEGADAFDFSDIYFRQRFGDTATLTLGKISIVDYCSSKPFMGGVGIDSFWNIVFAAPPSGTVPAYFFGALLSVKTDPITYGLWVYDPNSSVNKPGLKDAFADGVTIRGSVSVPVTLAGLGGHQGLAISYSTKNGNDWDTLNDVYLGVLPTAGVKTDRYYFSYTLDQYLFRSKESPEEGVGLFGQFEISDGNPNWLHWMAFGGVGGTGLVPGRSQDNWGVGYYYAAPAAGLKALVPPNPQLRDEQGLEAFYNLAVTPWFVLGADLQVVKAGASTDTAVLPGLRTVIRL